MELPEIRLLIVDDNPEDCEVYQEFLTADTSTQYHITVAHLGNDGLAAVDHQLPQVILLDYIMPDITGLEFIVQLQEKFQGLPCAVVMLTGAGSEDIAVQALRLGATDYTSKGDINYDTLPTIVQEALKRYPSKMQYACCQHVVYLQPSPLTYQLVASQLAESPIFDVTQATDLDTLHRIVETQQVDLILSDYYLPQNRKTIPVLLGLYPQVPIVVISSNSNEQQAVQSIKLGAYDYLTIHGKRLHNLGDVLKATLAAHEGALVRRQAEIALEKRTEQLTRANRDLEQ
ncbi:MAG: response regulator, partial [Okeania sp. SIO3B3]|nr:response regulator [Okeania sp. SIO3B3]